MPVSKATQQAERNSKYMSLCLFLDFFPDSLQITEWIWADLHKELLSLRETHSHSLTATCQVKARRRAHFWEKTSYTLWRSTQVGHFEEQGTSDPRSTQKASQVHCHSGRISVRFPSQEPFKSAPLSGDYGAQAHVFWKVQTCAAETSWIQGKLRWKPGVGWDLRKCPPSTASVLPRAPLMETYYLCENFLSSPVK